MNRTRPLLAVAIAMALGVLGFAGPASAAIASARTADVRTSHSFASPVAPMHRQGSPVLVHADAHDVSATQGKRLSAALLPCVVAVVSQAPVHVGVRGIATTCRSATPNERASRAPPAY